MSPDVFISYSRENQQKVIKLVEYMREQGVEAEDIGPSVRRLGLENEEELKALQDGCMQQINDFLSEKNDEVSKMMQQ